MSPHVFYKMSFFFIFIKLILVRIYPQIESDQQLWGWGNRFWQLDCSPLYSVPSMFLIEQVSSTLDLEIRFPAEMISILD